MRCDRSPVRKQTRKHTPRAMPSSAAVRVLWRGSSSCSSRHAVRFTGGAPVSGAAPGDPGRTRCSARPGARRGGRPATGNGATPSRTSRQTRPEDGSNHHRRSGRGETDAVPHQQAIGRRDHRSSPGARTSPMGEGRRRRRCGVGSPAGGRIDGEATLDVEQGAQVRSDHHLEWSCPRPVRYRPRTPLGGAPERMITPSMMIRPDWAARWPRFPPTTSWCPRLRAGDGAAFRELVSCYHP